MRGAAAEGDWATVDRLLGQASREFAGSEWVSAVLASMQLIAEWRSRERLMKESMYSSRKLRNRLTPKEEAIRYSAAMEASSQPAYLRRKPSQGKGSEDALLDELKP